MMKWCYDLAIDMSTKKGALWMLAIVSFVESSFFPIPPDIFLIPLVLANRDKAFLMAGVCTVASVLGGFFGYFIGFGLYDMVAEPIINFYNYQEQFNSFKHQYNDFGAWIVLMAGITPFPYKVITIASGVTNLDLITFGVASIVARGIRFYLVAWLLYKWGAPMKNYIEKNLGWLSIVFFILLIGSFYIIKFI